MSRRRNQNPSAAFEGLVWQVESGKSSPTVDPVALKVSAIKLLPEVFQHRRPSRHSSESHIRVLTDAAKNHGSLTPVTVWWSGQHWVCVDGHHRIAAYVRASMRTSEVPVEVFKGSPADALARAAETNSMDKLPMSKAEKVNAGWRLVVMGEALSKAKQAHAAGISERQIAAMRAVRKRLLGKGVPLENLAEMSWQAARMTDVGEDAAEWSEEETEKRAQKMATDIRKALGNTAETQPEIFFRAVEVYSTKLAKALEAWFGGEREDEDVQALQDA
jgi:hypothetical protein